MTPSADHKSEVTKDSTTPSREHFDDLLDRYITVWIWSVLFGASTGLVISLITYRTDVRWGLLNGLLLFFLFISISAAVISWRALMQYMSVYLIPKFLLHKFSTEEKKDESTQAGASDAKAVDPIKLSINEEKEAEIKAAAALRRAFEYLVIAAGARVVITLLEMGYASLGHPIF